MPVGRQSHENRGTKVPTRGLVDKRGGVDVGKAPNSGPFGVGSGYGPPGSDKPKGGRYYPEKVK